MTPILDTPNITARLWENGAERPFYGDEKFLVVRCREGKLDAIIYWGQRLGYSSRRDPDIEVVLRFDSDTPEAARWPPSTRYNATFCPQPEKFIEFLSEHRKLAVRTFPRSGGSLTAVFDLSEAKPVLDEVTAACRTSE